MKKVKYIFSILSIILSLSASSQNAPVDSIKFFSDEGLIDITLTTDIRKLQKISGEEIYQNADIICHFPDSSVVNEKIRIAARGHFRRNNCNIPPLLLNFHNSTSPGLFSLGKLKLVIGCGNYKEDNQLVLKEYLVYKIYNLLERKSFRVRLVRVSYRDSNAKIKPFSQYAFFIEDDNDMALRNGCEKRKPAQYLSEQTNRELMTKVELFQFMISNGDWSVPANHNIRLIFDKNKNKVPFVIPYDFDNSGFVNADYASPPDIFVQKYGVTKVTERVYRGYPRTMDELQAAFKLFRDNKNAIISLINNFTALSAGSRKEAVSFINEFYIIINDNKQVQNIFIDNARKN